MEHFPRFRRKQKDVATPTIITPANSASFPTKTTPPPGEPQPPPPTRPGQKLSPFRVFHRSSSKRARDSPPASLPHSPAAAAAVLAPDSSITDRPVSPLSLKTEAMGGPQHGAGRPPKIPAFLDLSEQDIEAKFGELVWLERKRLFQSAQNPSPDFRWARVSGPHLKMLDRYMNVQPWHNNRIKLQVPEGHVDYINASPITLIPSPRPATDSRPGELRESDNYIAMQGPKQASTDHVWRMVVEQLESPGVIVMLTETHEGHVEKCYPYFPRRKEDPPLEINQRDEFGDGFRATVRCEGMEETAAGDAIELRKLVIRVHSFGRAQKSTEEPYTPRRRATSLSRPTAQQQQQQQADEANAADSDVNMQSSPSTHEEQPGSSRTSLSSTSHVDTPQSHADSQSSSSFVEERIVWHFLYKKWPDFGVPALADLESFFTLMRLSREKNAGPHNPRIVHCSAGVGRSGTFIALEHLVRELDAGVLEHYDEHMATPSPASHTTNKSSTSSLLRFQGENGEEITASASAGFENTSPTTTSSMVCEEEGEDLIFNTVNQLREQRRTMVQAESQYLFIYQVLRKLWQDKYGSGSGSGSGGGGGGGQEDEGLEPAAKRLEVDPFVEG
ncbi:protein-tyrosine phosphatase-like protein [Cercophora scortea]|uniref:Protein-tyrosine phosphatase-like protein n=1 Tax=Cercophora scortea TaxID=314031 RepID=A0AAE0M3L3_9PEZI|nr:protein-tyrosine phosphatase-like protein [Cercophora scortea]